MPSLPARRLSRGGGGYLCPVENRPFQDNYSTRILNAFTWEVRSIGYVGMPSWW